MKKPNFKIAAYGWTAFYLGNGIAFTAWGLANIAASPFSGVLVLLVAAWCLKRGARWGLSTFAGDLPEEVKGIPHM